MTKKAPAAAPEPAETAESDKQEQADRLVKYHALAAAGLGVVPIPFLDFALIAGTQLNLIRCLAKLYGVPFCEQLGKSAVSALIGSTLPESGGSLLKLIPGLGSVLGCISTPAIASASTFGVGKVFVQHFESGGTFLDFDPARVKAHYQQLFEKGRAGEAADPVEKAPTEQTQLAEKERVEAEKEKLRVELEGKFVTQVKGEVDAAVAKQEALCKQELAAAAQQLALTAQELAAVKQQLAIEIARAAAVVPPAVPEAPAAPEAPEAPAAPVAPAAPEGPIIIVSVRFLGLIKGSQADEFVELRNTSKLPQDLSGWRLRSETRGQEFVFPEGTVIEPGVSIRVYTQLESPRPNCFTFGSKHALWNDRGDTAYLSDATGQVVAQHGYGSRETRTVDTIKAAFGVPGLRVVYEKEHLSAQKKYRGRMDFLTAVEDVLRCLFEEPVEGAAPTAASILRATAASAAADRPVPAVPELVRAHLNTQSLILVHSDALPEGITSLRDVWIFRLEPGLSERHFIFVSRTVTGPTYQKLS